MPTSFFTTPGRFHRGNLHTHSTGSDGLYSPQEVCSRYQAEGYDFIALTDHFVGLFDYPITDTTDFRNSQFTTIIGAELHTGVMGNGNLWHLLGIGLPLDFPPPHAPHFQSVDGSETAASIAQRARDAGAFVAIAHPHWSGMSQADALSVTAAHAVETYNHGCVVDNDRGEGFLILEHLLNQERRLNLIAADDAHFNTPDHFGGWVMVKTRENTSEALLAALKAGTYYSSTGPEIHDIRFTSDCIEVDCTAAATIVVQGKGTSTATLHGKAMTRESLSLARLRNSPWVRVTIVDRTGKRAWSNPIWLDG
ncbi:PHP domain-containing protein [Pseudohalocynthiibacter aestuariivivens]|jgi:PHP domain|uniref:PHP domain-containing protein n=1 Tax=Pseudohalocynthiibacter aestuariivivens TaxID=1591409 RepID=A0ABV5JDR8_9RHOB|nr:MULTISPECIES: CehA/McbA family metallohydrolase [Pseudohalocynthiibacter]MBS9718699.1 CehA/McbA family metallohydrolase [Pseudohalocynthiibacter aestuariivivens]MCK0104318.1 CehA/McbA family metallohydrolase [Pseudohalocynthiibacter sp. F2068]